MNLGFLLSETFDIARRALTANRMRSMLALLGIVIGVGTVIGMVALINGFQRSFQQNIQAFGNNTLYIRRIRPGIQFNGGVPDSLKARKAFNMGDAEAILTHSPAVAAVSVFKFAFNDIKLSRRNKTTKTTFIYGTNDQLLRTHGYDMARGRFFTQEEVRGNANVVVLGHDTRETLFGDAAGIGQTVHLNGIPFTVVGEFESKGRFLGNNFDEVACVPYPLIDKYWGTPSDAPPWFPKKGELFLDAVATTPEVSEEAIRQISEVLRVRRHLPSNKGNDFVVFSQATVPGTAVAGNDPVTVERKVKPVAEKAEQLAKAVAKKAPAKAAAKPAVAKTPAKKAVAKKAPASKSTAKAPAKKAAGGSKS